MTNLPANPQEDSSKKSEEDLKIKRPEFIILDDTQDYLRRQQRTTNARPPLEEESFRTVPIMANPLVLRVVCFLGMIASLLVTVGMFIWVVFFFLIALLLFFQVRSVNDILYRTWRIYTNAFAAAIGFALAAISPVLGIGFLVIYFSLRKESANQNVLQILKNLFTRI